MQTKENKTSIVNNRLYARSAKYFYHISLNLTYDLPSNVVKWIIQA